MELQCLKNTGFLLFLSNVFVFRTRKAEQENPESYRPPAKLVYVLDCF